MKLSPRQKQVQDGILAGLQDKEVANNLNLNLKAVKHCAAVLYKKYEVEGRAQLILKVKNEEIKALLEKVKELEALP